MERIGAHWSSNLLFIELLLLFILTALVAVVHLLMRPLELYFLADFCVHHCAGDIPTFCYVCASSFVTQTMNDAI